MTINKNWYKFRFFRIKYFSGKWGQYNSLDYEYIGTNVHSVYFSTSRWLNAQNVQGRKCKKKNTWKWANNLFLGSEFYIDVDKSDFIYSNTPLERAYEELIKIKSYLENQKGFRNIRMVFSGNGFHLWCENFEDVMIKNKNIPNPKLREQYYLHIKERLSNELIGKGFIFDELISKDTRRILRVPGTINGKNMRKCVFINALSDVSDNIVQGERLSQ